VVTRTLERDDVLRGTNPLFNAEEEEELHAAAVSMDAKPAAQIPNNMHLEDILQLLPSCLIDLKACCLLRDVIMFLFVLARKDIP
jgi:hypothetical protein